MNTPYAIPDCPRARYDSIQAMNQSLLKEMQFSAAHLRYKQTAPPTPPTPQMTLGSLTEHLVFGTLFEWVPMKFKDFKTDAAQEWRDDMAAQGVAIVTTAVMAKAKAMAARVMALPEFKSWQPWRTNVALVGTHEPTGLACKGLLDCVPNDQLLLLDLKTTADASIRGFGKSIADFGYSCQAAWYQNLWRQVYNEDRQFCFMAIESEPPYEPSIQVLRQYDIDKAWRQIGIWLEQYKTCSGTDKWPGYGSGVLWAEPPPWLFNDV